MERLKREWEFLRDRKIFLAIFFGGIVFQFFHNVAHNYVYYLAGKYKVYGGADNQLVDLGFKALEPFRSLVYLSFLPSNGCLYALGVIALLTSIANSTSWVRIIWRALLVCSIAIFLRCVSFLLTILPAPAPQCAQSLFDPPSSALSIFFRFSTDNGCSDLIFSSHMMYGLIATCTVVHYSSTCYAKTGMKYCIIGLCLSLNIAQGVCIVAQERHYTIDVWTSMYVVPLTWVCFYHLIPSDPTPSACPQKSLTHTHTPCPADVI